MEQSPRPAPCSLRGRREAEGVPSHRALEGLGGAGGGALFYVFKGVHCSRSQVVEEQE